MAADTIPADTIEVNEARRASAPRLYYPGIALAVIVTSQLMLILDGTIVNIALPHIRRSLGFSETGLSWVLNAYALPFGGLLLLGGRAGDILGRRRIFFAGILLFTAASLVGGFATSAGWLVTARAAQGIGAAIAAPSALALITTTFAEGPKRTRAIGIYSAVQAAGASIGLIVGGMLTSWVSWRWVMFVNVPIGVAILLLVPIFVQESTRNPGRFDLSGALTSTIGAVSLVYGFIRAAEQGWADPLTLAAFALALLLLASFVAVEMRALQPVMPLRLFADRNRAAAYVNMLLAPAAMLGMFFFLTQFVQDALGYSAVKAGVAFLPLTLAIFGSAQMVPRLLPRFGAKPLFVSGTALITAGMGLLTRIAADTSYAPDLLAPMLLFGVGAGFILVPLSLLILSDVQPRDSGAASGLLQAMQQIGGSLGIAVLVTVFGRAGRDAAASSSIHALADAIGSAFTASALIAAVALLLALVAIRTSPAGTSS